MELRTILQEQIEREYSYFKNCTVGSEEYVKSFERLGKLVDKWNEVDHFESDTLHKDKQMDDERKDRIIKNAIEGVKTAGGILLPLIGYVAITSFERDCSYTTALRGVLNCFIPKRL